jgi:Cu(I)/Ag(I) efflux system membrane fusion protein
MYASAKIHVPLSSHGTPQATGLEGKYICPMHPDVVRDEPGECPICGMALEQVPDLFPPQSPVADQEHTAHQVGDGHAEMQGKVLAVRKTAVLDTGRRQIAYRKRPDGAYELVDLQLGPAAAGQDDSGQLVSYFPVLGGLHPGDEVVVQGGFLLDSQRQIEGMPSLLYEEGRSAASLHAGHGAAAAPAPAAPAAQAGGHQH